ncbi:Ionotropic receptor 21a [Halyomorpha halys]|nr:Ionotropic receptor 21a [Halyomorpha halys]
MGMYSMVDEEHGTENCGIIIPELVMSVINFEIKPKLVKIIFDDLHKADYKFKLNLDKIIKGIHNSAVVFGQKSSAIEAINDNEQPAWIIFSAQPESLPMKGKILLIIHVSVFQLKEWLLSPKVKKHQQQLVVISDPALKKSKGSEKDCDTGLYTQFINPHSFGRGKALILTSWRNHNFTQSVKIFPSEEQTLYNGNHLVVYARDQPPFAFKRILENGEVIWDGVEVRLLLLMKEILNFTMEFQDHIGKQSSDTLQILRQGNTDLVVGGFVMTKEIYGKTSMIYPHFMDCAAFISLTSIALPKYKAVMGPFLWDVWISITLCYILAIIPIAFSAWHTLGPLIQHPSEIENMFWYVFGTFTNCFTFRGQFSWTKSVKNSTKLFIGTYWMFTIIITACYTGSIIAFITLPVYPEVMNTMHQLLHKNYRVTTMADEGWWTLLIGSDDDVASGLAGTAETVNNVLEGLSTVIKSSKEDKPVTFLGSSEHLKHILKSNCSASDVSKRQLFHISRQCFVPQMISMIMPHDSIYIDSFSRSLIKAIEAGFINKIQQDLEWNLYKSSARQTLLQGNLKLEALERQLTLEDTQGMFLLLGCGFAFAVCAFGFELGTWIKNRKGEKLTIVVKERILAASRRVSAAFLTPYKSHIRDHYPLYFRNVSRRKSSLFGSMIILEPSDRQKPPTAVSEIHLMPPKVEKPIRLLSF